MSEDAGAPPRPPRNEDEQQGGQQAAAPVRNDQSSLYSSWLSTDFGNASLSTLDLQGSDAWGGGTPSPAGSSVWASHSTLGGGASGGGGAFPFDSSTSSVVPGTRPGGAAAAAAASHRRNVSLDGKNAQDPLLLGSTARPGSVGLNAPRAVSLGVPVGGSIGGRSPSIHQEKPSDAVTSALHDAARITNWRGVHALSLSQPQSARYTGPDRWTALHHACSRRCPHAYVVEALLRAYPGALLDLDEKGWTPLHHASRFKAPRDVVRLLLETYPDRGRAASSKRCSRGRTPLYYAIRYDAPDGVVEMLLGADPGAVLEPDRDGVTPLALVWDKYATSFEGKRAVQPYLGELHASLEAGAGEGGSVGRLEGLGGEGGNGGGSRSTGGGSAVLTNKKLRSKWERANVLLRAAFRFPPSDDGDEGVGSKSDNSNRVDEGEDEDGDEGAETETETEGSPVKSKPSKVDDAAAVVALSKQEQQHHKRKWRILHAASAVKCHTSLFSLACVLYPEQVHEIDENDLYGDGVDRPEAGHNGDSGEPSSLADSPSSDPARQQQPRAKSNRTALHFAAASPSHGREGRTVLTCLLALNPAAAGVADGVDGSLPLHLAVENERKGHWSHDGLAALHGANADAVRVCDALGRTPLHRACTVLAHRSSSGSSAPAPAPAAGAPPVPAPAPAMPPPPGESAVQVPPQAPSAAAPAVGGASGEGASSEAGDTAPAPPTAADLGSIVQNLVVLYRGAATVTDSTGRLPLHLVAEHGESWGADAEAVLTANPAAARARAGRGAVHGRLPIHLAAASPDAGPSLFAKLVEAHPRGASLPDATGKLPLHLACESGKRWSGGFVETIHEAYPQAVTLREDNARKWMALHMAAACPHAGPDLIDNLTEIYPQAAAEVDGGGRYPLHWACASGKPWDAGLKTIFDAYPDAAIEGDANGWLPFHCAAMSYSVPTNSTPVASASEASMPRTSSASSDDSVVTTSTGGGDHEPPSQEEGEPSLSATTSSPGRGRGGGDTTGDSIDELTKINILYALIREAPHGL